jgi:hypothetical protein
LDGQNDDAASVATSTTVTQQAAPAATPGRPQRKRELHITRMIRGRERVEIIRDERVISAYYRHRKEQKTQDRTERRALASKGNEDEYEAYPTPKSASVSRRPSKGKGKGKAPKKPKKKSRQMDSDDSMMSDDGLDDDDDELELEEEEDEEGLELHLADDDDDDDDGEEEDYESAY